MKGKIFIPRRHCWQSKRRLRRSLFSSLRFLARLGSGMLFLQPHLSCVFFFLFFFRCFYVIDSSGASCGVSKQPVLAVAQGLNAAVGDPFPHSLGSTGVRDGEFWMDPRGVRPHLLPEPLLSLPWSQTQPWGWGAAFASAKGFWGALQCSQSHTSFIFFPAKAEIGGENSPGGIQKLG